MRIVREIDIGAPHARVWQLLSDDASRKLWMPDLIATTYPAGRPTGDPTGSTFRETMREGGSIRSFAGTVTAFVEGRMMAVRLQDHQLRMEIDYRLNRNANSTGLRYSGEFQLVGVMGGMMIGMARPMIEGMVSRQLDSLKRVAEAKTDARGDG